MNVKRIVFKNLMSHDHTEVEFPDQGVVLITGSNGAGKSSFVEGVSWAAHGKTLRGDLPWRDDAKVDPCSVVLTTDEIGITRERNGAKTKLEWIHFEGEANEAPGSSSASPEYETTSKAAEALQKMLGPFELWRRTHVFSSSDAMHFSLATDGERKKLIETFLGNESFNPALKSCRADLKDAENRLAAAEHRSALLTVELNASRTRLKETKQALAASAPPEPETPVRVGKPLLHYDGLLRQAQQEMAALSAKLRTADRAGAEFEAEVRNANNLLARLRTDTCPTCEQAIPATLRHALQEKARVAKKQADAAKVEAAAGLADVEVLLEDLKEETAAIQKKREARARELQDEMREKDAHRRQVLQRELLEKQYRQADEAIRDVTTKLEEVEKDLELAKIDVQELSAVEYVLGLKGVRATILGKSLGGIEAVANTWLSRLHSSAELGLECYSESGTSDSISLTVRGLGRGTYKSISAGERRRVDVSLLLGLAEVAAAAQGQTPGTLWFDEVLDALDDDGKEGVAEALIELSKTRCVVVITHDKWLVKRLPAALRLHVALGKVERIGSSG